MPKQKPPGHVYVNQSSHPQHSSINTNMDKVKIKRVKRNKEKITAKAKILAGLGVGGSILGGVSSIVQKPNKTAFVSTQNQGQNKAALDVKGKLSKIFKTAYDSTVGISKAHAEDMFAEDPYSNAMWEGEDDSNNGGGFSDFGGGFTDAAASEADAQAQAITDAQDAANAQAAADEQVAAAAQQAAEAETEAEQLAAQEAVDVAAQAQAQADVQARDATDAAKALDDARAATDAADAQAKAEAEAQQQEQQRILEQQKAADDAQKAADKAKSDAAAQAKFDAANQAYFNSTGQPAASATANPNQSSQNSAQINMAAYIQSLVDQGASSVTPNGDGSYIIVGANGSSQVISAQTWYSNYSAWAQQQQQPFQNSANPGFNDPFSGLNGELSPEQQYQNMVNQTLASTNSPSNNNASAGQNNSNQTTEQTDVVDVQTLANLPTNNNYSPTNFVDLSQVSSFQENTEIGDNNSPGFVAGVGFGSGIGTTSGGIILGTSSAAGQTDGNLSGVNTLYGPQTFSVNGDPLYVNASGRYVDSQGNIYDYNNQNQLVAQSTVANQPTTIQGWDAGQGNSGNIIYPSATQPANTDTISVVAAAETNTTGQNPATQINYVGNVKGAMSPDGILTGIDGSSYDFNNISVDDDLNPDSTIVNATQSGDYTLQSGNTLNGAAAILGRTQNQEVIANNGINNAGNPNAGGSLSLFVGQSLYVGSVSFIPDETGEYFTEQITTKDGGMADGQTYYLNSNNQLVANGVVLTPGTAAIVLGEMYDNNITQIGGVDLSSIAKAYNIASGVDTLGTVALASISTPQPMGPPEAINTGIGQPAVTNPYNEEDIPGIGSPISENNTIITTPPPATITVSEGLIVQPFPEAAQQTEPVAFEQLVNLPTVQPSYGAKGINNIVNQTIPFVAPVVNNPISAAPVTLSEEPPSTNIPAVNTGIPSIILSGQPAVQAPGGIIVESLSTEGLPILGSMATESNPENIVLKNIIYPGTDTPKLPAFGVATKIFDPNSPSLTATHTQPAALLPDAPAVKVLQQDPISPLLQNIISTPPAIYMPVWINGEEQKNQYLGSDGRFYTKNSGGGYTEVDKSTVAKLAGTVQAATKAVADAQDKVKEKGKGLLAAIGNATGIKKTLGTYKGSTTGSEDPNDPVVTIKDENKNDIGLYQLDKGVFFDAEGNIYAQTGKSQYKYVGIDITQLDPKNIPSGSQEIMIGPKGELMQQIGEGTFKDSKGNVYTYSSEDHSIQATGLKVNNDGGLQTTKIIGTNNGKVDKSVLGVVESLGGGIVKGGLLGGGAAGGAVGAGMAVKEILTQKTLDVMIKWANDPKKYDIPGDFTFVGPGGDMVSMDKFVVQNLQQSDEGKAYLASLVQKLNTKKP